MVWRKAESFDGSRSRPSPLRSNRRRPAPSRQHVANRESPLGARTATDGRSRTGRRDEPPRGRQQQALGRSARPELRRAPVGRRMTSPTPGARRALPTGVERAQACNAHRRRLECIADRAEQRLGNCREPVQRTAARAQEEHLDCRGDSTIVTKSIADRRNVVLAQRKGFTNVVLGQPARQVLDCDEALGKGHGSRPGSKARNLPLGPLAKNQRRRRAIPAAGRAQMTVSI